MPRTRSARRFRRRSGPISSPAAVYLMAGAALEPRAELLIELAVDQHEQYAANLVGAIDPCMIGAALDQHIAGFERDFALVQQHREFAFEDHRVVERLGA